MATVSANKLELLQIAEAVAREKAIDRRIVLGAMEDAIIKRMEGESTALYATARLWDDGLIDPRDTRKVLGFCLSICREAELRPLKRSTFGVARM